jgi:hypothetical protein
MVADGSEGTEEEMGAACVSCKWQARIDGA